MEKEIPKSISLNLTLFALSHSAGYLWLTMLVTDVNTFNDSTRTGIVLQERHRYFYRTQTEFIHTW